MATVLALCVLLLSVIIGPVALVDPVFSPASVSDTLGNSADSEASITWAPLTSGDPYIAGPPARTNERLASFHEMMHGFVVAVFSGGVPTDIMERFLNIRLGERTSNTNFFEILRLRLCKLLEDIRTNFQKYIPYSIGYALCILVGLLFLIVFPIVIICVCCCRCCCGNCGGKNSQRREDAVNSCRKSSLTLAVFLCMVMITTSTLCMYDDSISLSTTLEKTTNVLQMNIDDVKTFFNNTHQQATQIARTDFDFFTTVITRDLNNVEYLIGLPLRQAIENQTDIRTTLASAEALYLEMPTISTLLDYIEDTENGLTASMTALESALEIFVINLDNYIAGCSTGCAGAPNHMAATTLLNTTNFNTTAIAFARVAFNSSNGINITSDLTDAAQQLDDIPEMVKNDSQPTVNSLINTTNSLSDQIDPMLNQLDDLTTLVNGANATFNLDEYVTKVDNYLDSTTAFDKFRIYAVLGIAGLNGLIVVTALMGVCCGWCCSNVKVKPHRRSNEAHCGGVCLSCSVVLACVLSFLFMLVVLPLFLVGAPLERIVCRPLRNMDELEQMINVYNDKQVGAGKYFLGKTLMSNDSIPLTLPGILRSCKANAGVFDAFALSSKFNIDDLLDYTSTLDVQTELDGINVDMSGVTLYTADLQNMLSDLQSALDLQGAYYPELNNEVAAMNLTALADDLEAFATTQTGIRKTNFQSSTAELRSIISEEYAYAVGNQSALAGLLTQLATLKNRSRDVDAGLQAAENFIQNNVTMLVTSLLTEFATRVLGIVDSYTDFALTAVKTKMGPCQPIWNIYNSIMVYTFCYNIMDVINGVWFALGWCIFFFLPSIIFSLKLAKYFKKMDKDSNLAASLTGKHNKVAPEDQMELTSDALPNKQRLSEFDAPPAYSVGRTPFNKVRPSSINDW